MITILKKVNNALSEWYVKQFNYEPYIQTILLHKIYNTRKEITPLNGTIAEGVDKTQFETFIRYFKNRDVKFINETDILEGRIDPKKQYIYLTFDDGYYNNFNCLDILNKYNVKATFFITTNHIKEGKAYWWDALSRELTLRNKYNQLKDRVNELYLMKWYDQEKYMVDNFGVNALKSDNDLDRPMTVEELKIFSKNKNVTLGNHTHNHINLELYDNNEIVESLKSAESFLNEITGKEIKSISYPHGFVNRKISDLVRKSGYEIGITTVPKKNYFSSVNDPDQRMLLNRAQLSGYFNIEEQSRNIHTNNFLISSKIKSFWK